jgi:S-adenosylmethionine-dependent methyltransferase
MPKQHVLTDRNFDDLAERFKRNIYGGLKGEIRLAVLHRDFAEFVPVERPLRVLDAGGGQGQFSLELARAGHEVVICDISAEMLRLAREQVETDGLEERVTLLHCSVQELGSQLPVDGKEFDLVLCHALMEWMAEPETLLPCLMRHMKAEGYLSLTFYNRHSMVYKNLLRTNYRKVLERDYAAFRGSLTPINPLEPAQVNRWLAAQPLEVLCTSGIRVFYDYILDPEARRQTPEAVLELELRLSREEPYRSLGRYIHVLARHAGQSV